MNMYYGLGQAQGAPVAGKPVGWAGAQGIHALTQLPSRDTHLRRQIYRQFWHEKTILAGASGDIVFFRELDSNIRVSNMEAAGQIPVRKAVLLKKLIVRPCFGTSGPDQAAFFDRSIVRLHIEGDDAYRFLAFTLNQGVGLINSPLVALGEPAPQKAFDLGMIPLGAGQSFNVTIHLSQQIATANDMLVTTYIHTLTDEPIT